MIKFRVKGKDYWVGCNPKIGYVIFDPLIQNAEIHGQVRLYVIDRKKSAHFKKDIIRNNFISDATLDRGHCLELIQPYAKARERLRMTYCFRCSENLNTSDFGICDICGWIQCTCGACGCKYRKKT